MKPPILGVDPGKNGGAAVLLSPEDRKLLALFSWKRRGSTAPALVLSWAFPRVDDDPIRGRLGGIHSGYRLGLTVDNVLRANRSAFWALVCEDAYLGKSPKVAMDGARWAGQFTGPLEEGSLRWPVAWVRADEWRAEAFGIKRGTRREIAKQATYDRLPPELRSEAEALAARMDGMAHVTDALGIALWGSGLRVALPERSRKRRGG